MNWSEQLNIMREQQFKLGIEFIEEVYSTILRIVEFPKAFPIYSLKTRKCLVNRFPFAVIYQIKNKEIFIATVAHLARKTGYWTERLSE